MQVPSEFQKIIEEPCRKLSLELGKALAELASSLRAMKCSSKDKAHIQNCEAALKNLRAALVTSSLGKTDLMEIVPSISVGSLLIEISRSVGKISDSIHELSDKASFESEKPTLSTQILHSNTVKPLTKFAGEDDTNVVITIVHGTSSFHDSPEIKNSSQVH